MAKRTDKTGWTASGNFNTVRFDVVEPPFLDTPNLPKGKNNKRFHSKYLGVTRTTSTPRHKGKTYRYYYWKAHLSRDNYREATTRKTEIEAALQYDRWVYKYKLDRITNYDLYGEYWK